MITFKFRNKEYRVERDPHQFILSQKYVTEKGEITYHNLGYYSDAKYLIKKLLSLHLISAKDSTEILSLMKTICDQLGNVLNRAIKVSVASSVER